MIIERLADSPDVKPVRVNMSAENEATTLIPKKALKSVVDISHASVGHTNLPVEPIEAAVKSPINAPLLIFASPNT